MPVLELKHVSKHFGAIEAVRDVSFTLEAGEVIGLMGDNGAEESTLATMIAGNFRPSAGSILMDGKEIVMHRPVEARQHGIEIVHQDLALRDNLTAAANVFLGREMQPGSGPFPHPGLCVDESARGRDIHRIEIRNPTPRSCEKDVRRPATSCCHRPDAAQQRQDRVDG